MKASMGKLQKNDFITFGSDWVSESDKNIVKLCVHFVSVCIKVQKWRQTETKVTFHPPENFFLSQMKGMAKIRLFFRCYGIDFAPIKKYHSKCFF